MIKIRSKNAKGFSMIETLVSMFIFSLMMAMLAGSFSSFLREFMVRKKEQKVLENAQYTLSLIEKTIRTSTLFVAAGTGIIDFNGGDGRKIKLFDYSQSKCLAYQFDGFNKKIVLLTNPAAVSVDTCGDFQTGYTSVDLTSNNIKSVSVEGWNSSADTPGRVSVAITLNAPGSNSELNIGMTASLRSFTTSAPPPPPSFPTCADGLQNGTETGIDCGGSCSACPVILNSIYFTGSISRSTSYGFYTYAGGKNFINGTRSDSGDTTSITYDPATKSFNGGMYYIAPFDSSCPGFSSYEILSSALADDMYPTFSNKLAWYGDNWQCYSIYSPGGTIVFDPDTKTMSGQINFTGGSTDVTLTAVGNSIVGSGGASGTITVEFKP
ncbi:MAG: hypothetical protein ACD_5C00159G0001 [uncultured bacterium]|nr:MAG: hypothetical protein ACD_5C00159G0001 [uncultured bacterium]